MGRCVVDEYQGPILGRSGVADVTIDPAMNHVTERGVAWQR